MPDDDLAPVGAGPEAGLSTAGRCWWAPPAPLAAAGLSGPARAAGHATSVAARSGRALTRTLRVSSSRRCATRCAIRACTPRARSCTCAARGSAAGPAPLGSVAWRRPNRCAARSLPRRQHREAVRRRRRAAAGRARPAVARRPAARGAARRASPAALPTRPTSRFACCSATAPGSRIGTAPPSTSRSRAIPPRCGGSASSSISRPRSRRCSRRERASPTPTPTTPCSA